MSGAGPSSAYDRERLRESYVHAWRKHLARVPLTPLEATIADVVVLHPEYQPLLQDADAALGFDAAAAGPRQNPFLHMGLHLALREQLSIDRPPGVRALRDALEGRLGNAHEAEHALMEALAEALWEARRGGGPPDEMRYLELARRSLRRA